MKKSKRIWLSWLLFFFGLSTLSAQQSGAIQGQVLDATGKPVAGAKVHALLRGDLRIHKISEFAETDADGKFSIDHLPWGTYLIVARKETDGYPDTRLAFYSNLQAPSVTLNDTHPTGDIMISLAPPAGILELSVVNAQTGEKLTNAVVTLRRVSSPQLFITTSTTVPKIAVPSLTDVQVQISAPGYASWSGEAGPLVINLQPKEEKHLEISLRPSS